MKIINFNDVRSLNVSPVQCYEWVNDMILHKADASLPTKTHMNMPGNVFCNVMPGIVHTPELPWGGKGGYPLSKKEACT